MVRAIMIVEMAGRPAAHLTESLEKHVGILREVNDIEVERIEVSEPREIPREDKSLDGGRRTADGGKEEQMFTSFAECEFEIPSFARLSETMFDFMPSSIEVMEPSKVSLEATEATDLLNNISGRMHRYDEIAKVAGEKMRVMSAQLQMAQKILIARDKQIAELSGKKSNSTDSKKTSSAKKK